MTTKLYLDTSIPSAFYDNSNPRRQFITKKWFEHDSTQFELYTSSITFNEIERIKNEFNKLNIESLLYKFKVTQLPITSQSEYLND